MTAPTTALAAKLREGRRRWPRMATAVAIIAVTSGVAATVALGSDDGGSRYRTATAAVQDVAETMTEIGTIQPISQAAVAFPTAGTIADIDVQVGDTVQIGDLLATLDTEALEADVRAAQAALDEAVLTLERARNGESIVGGGGSSTGGGEVAGLTATGAVRVTLDEADEQPDAQQPAGDQPTGNQTGGDDTELGDAQQAVIDAQRQVDANIRAAAEALASAEAICESLGEDAEAPSTTTTTAPADEDDQPASTTSTTSTTAPADQDDEPESTSTTTTTAPASEDEAPPTTSAIRMAVAGDEGAAASACYDALAAVLDAQQATQTSQNRLAEAADALDTLLAERAAASGTDNSSTPTGSTSSPTGSAGSQVPSSGGQSAPSGSTSSSPSSEDLIAYQKAVDAAELQLLVAQHALDNNTIVSPIAGTVVSVDIESGQAVEATSDTATVVVAGDDAFEVTAEVSVDDLPELEVGQAATVVPDGSSEQVAGEIVAIGLAASSGSPETTYQITIGVDGDASGLRNGSVASIDITTAEATQSIAVPTTAVKVDNGQYFALVLHGDTAERVDVEIGAIGATWTEITDGLRTGDVVVVADLEERLPGTATETDAETTFGGGGPGGFPGQPGN